VLFIVAARSAIASSSPPHESALALYALLALLVVTVWPMGDIARTCR